MRRRQGACYQDYIKGWNREEEIQHSILEINGEKENKCQRSSKDWYNTCEVQKSKSSSRVDTRILHHSLDQKGMSTTFVLESVWSRQCG